MRGMRAGQRAAHGLSHSQSWRSESIAPRLFVNVDTTRLIPG